MTKPECLSGCNPGEGIFWNLLIHAPACPNAEAPKWCIVCEGVLHEGEEPYCWEHRQPAPAEAPKCDCWKHERQVCDICAGGGKDKPAPAPTPEPPKAEPAPKRDCFCHCHACTMGCPCAVGRCCGAIEPNVDDLGPHEVIAPCGCRAERSGDGKLWNPGGHTCKPAPTVEPASDTVCKCGHSKIRHSMYEDLDECRFCECDLFDLLKAGETPEPVLNRDELIARIEFDAKVIAAMASEVSRLNLDLGGQIVALRAEVERLKEAATNVNSYVESTRNEALRSRLAEVSEAAKDAIEAFDDRESVGPRLDALDFEAAEIARVRDVAAAQVIDQHAKRAFLVQELNRKDKLIAGLVDACEAAYDRITNILGPLGEHLDNPIPTKLRAALVAARQKEVGVGAICHGSIAECPEAHISMATIAAQSFGLRHPLQGAADKAAALNATAILARKAGGGE